MNKVFKLIFMLTFICVIFSSDANAQITVSGSNGKDGIYTSLTNAAGAFLALNGTDQTGRNILITITADVVAEAGTNPLTGAAGMWTSLTINPGGGVSRTISGSIAGKPIIDISGADYVTIDGLNTGGNSLTITNTSSSGAGNTSTIRLINDATNNTITNCTVLGSSTGLLAAANGNIVISTGTTIGNDNITISNCNLGPVGASLPTKLIFSSGSTTSSDIANSNVTINNNNLYDFFLTSGCAGVYALTGNTDWTITNNKVYQTDTRTFTAAGTMYGIYFANAAYGNNIQIAGNTIGYASSSGIGTLTLTGAFTGAFTGIYLTISPTAAIACNVNSNIISDISLTSTTGTFYGIYNNATTATSNTININSNYIRNITLVTTTGQAFGINWSTATNMTINGNSVYNITRDNSGNIYGIFSGVSSPSNETITNNNIYNLSATSTTVTSTIFGIGQSTSTGTKVFQNNNIYNLTGSFGNTIYGMNIAAGTTVDISGNNIYSFTTTNGATHIIYGLYIYQTAVTMNVYKNNIYGLSGGGTNSQIYGITTAGSISGITRYIYNNFITDLTAPSSSNGEAIRGLNINLTAATSTIGVYYNTVFLTGSGVTSFGSSGIYHVANATSTTATLDMRNNIIVNNCTPSGTGKVVAFRRSGGTAGMLANYASTSNNNLFYAGAPDASHLIYYDITSSAQTIAAYKTGVFTAGTIAPRDAASVTELPPFENIASTPYNLHINLNISTQCESHAIRITAPFAVTTDYDGDLRYGETGYIGTGIAPDIGADEFNSSYITGNINLTGEIPGKYNLYQNYPNPFNPNTIIKFSIPENGKWKMENGIVTLKIFDILGKEIATLVNEKLQPGIYEVPFSINQFSNNQFPNGVYFARIEAGDYRHVIKMLLVK